MTGKSTPFWRTVHVIEDDEAVRRAIAMLLRSARYRAETYEFGLAFLKELPTIRDAGASCVLTDLRMPGLDGLELFHRLRTLGFTGPVIVMTAHGDVVTAVRAIKAGVTDFIEKPFDDDTLLAAIGAALDQAQPPPAAAEAAARIGSLKPREREVLELLMQGKQNKVVALELGLSTRTVEVHRARLMARLDVGSLAEAVRLAVRAELGSES